MPLFLPTLIFAISLSLLPGTEPAVEEEPGQTGVTSTPNGQPATPHGDRPQTIRSADSADSANSESSALKQKLEERVVGSSAPTTRRTHPRLTRSFSMPLAPRSDFPHQPPSSTSNSSVSSPTSSPRLSPSTAQLPAAPPRAITPI